MNQRIKELINDAILEVEDIDEFDEPFVWTMFDKEKFAKLIIEECIAKAEEEAERYLGFPNLKNADMYAKVMYNYQALLKEHFGIE